MIPEFEKWWRSSKYWQIVIPLPGWKQIGEDAYAAGLERAAVYLEEGFYDRSPLAKAIRTLKDGGEPCEHCGYPLPQHESSCVRWHIQEPQ